MWIFYAGYIFNTNDVSYIHYYIASKMWRVAIHFKDQCNSPNINIPYDTEDEAVEAMEKLQKQFNGN